MKNKFALLCLIVAALTLAACSSKKKAVVVKNPRPTPVHVVPSTDKQLKKLISEARSWIGTPYVYGGSTKGKGTDCSGMIMQLFSDVYGLKLPRSSAMQREVARQVKFADMRPGDLVFFTTNKTGSHVNHVGLYVGDNRMIHASSSRGVMESALDLPYWQQAYHSSGCVIETDARKALQKSPAIPDTTTTPSVPLKDLQRLYNALDHQIDSVYVANPEIFD